jgi:hypothetical protein
LKTHEVVEVSESYITSLRYNDLRKFAVSLGVLVQDDPSLDVLRQRIRQCRLV